MCSHYEAPTPSEIAKAFGASPDFEQRDLWPGYSGPFVRRDADDEDSSAPKVSTGVFGLLPGWAKDEKLARRTFNARSETASQKPSFRSAWKNGQTCIIPAKAIFEPDWRSGKSVATRIERLDGSLMAIAGLWERWINPKGEEVLSFTMLTINADEHALMKNFHRPDAEKRMVVILPNGLIKDWLNAPPNILQGFMRPYPADRLGSKPVA